MAQVQQGNMNQLPPEIVHITQGYISLQSIIARLSQKTHADLIKTIKDLAQLPLSSTKSIVNGSQASVVDDNSVENLAKKLRLLKFATDSHEAWTKTLVIIGWSRKAEDVSKIIDLKVHLDQRQQDFVSTIEKMAHDKRGYIHARLPNPDIKTALEVMGTGKASWMPDLGYIPPPKLTARDILEVLERLNTLLSIRLNLEEYDKLPYHFKNFHVKSGRVTFHVDGEFELDLTIAEETPEAQFWFLDLRFLFSPSLKTLSQSVRNYLENKINSVLLKDGLKGCYDFLHDIVLTYKIAEFKRQSLTLSKYRWVHSIKVEALNRSICIQYWIDRFHRVSKDTKTPKSWLILGVHSGLPKTGKPDIRATRRLGIRWFRENKEQKDVDIPIDHVHISAEALLTSVVSQHIAFILTSIYQNLLAKPLYSKQDLSLNLSISTSDPAKSELKVQLTTIYYLTIKIEPISGLFIFEPPSRRILDYQRRLNAVVTDPAGRTHEHIELLRYSLMYDSLLAHGWSTGWKNIRNPGVNNLEMKRVFKDAAQVHWFRRTGWVSNWYLTVSMNMAGENWNLVHTAMTSDPTNPNGVMVIPVLIKMPIKAISPGNNYSFMIAIRIFAAALFSHYENLKYLWSRRCLYMLMPSIKSGPLNLPFIYIRLSELLDSQNILPKTGKPWANNYVRLRFQGIRCFALPSGTANKQEKFPQASEPKNSSPPKQESKEDEVIMVAEVQILKPIPRSLSLVRKEFEKNIIYHPSTGCFAVCLHSSFGGTVIPVLSQYIARIERLVGFIKILEKHEATLKCTKICLEEISFMYGKISNALCQDDVSPSNLIYNAAIEFSTARSDVNIRFEKGNPHIRIADHLKNILNAPLGLDCVAKVMPLTVHVLNGIGVIEATWATSPMCEYGMVTSNSRAVDWYIIRYTLIQANPQTPASRTRKFFFEIQMRQRKGEAWWHVQRKEPLFTEESEKSQRDDLDEALKPFWKMNGKDWIGMRISAVGKNGGIIDLLENLDKFVREFAMNDGIWSYRPISKAPTAQMSSTKSGLKVKQTKPLQNRPVSLSGLNQELHHGGLQARAVAVKREREIVEID